MKKRLALFSWNAPESLTYRHFFLFDFFFNLFPDIFILLSVLQQILKKKSIYTRTVFFFFAQNRMTLNTLLQIYLFIYFLGGGGVSGEKLVILTKFCFYLEQNALEFIATDLLVFWESGFYFWMYRGWICNIGKFTFPLAMTIPDNYSAPPVLF